MSSGIQFMKLEQLEDHLRHGEMLPGGFCYADWFTETACGTAGCAIGHCPTVWPEEWRVRRCSGSPIGHPVLLHNHRTDQSIEEWFGLVWEQACHLFYLPKEPECLRLAAEYVGRYGGNIQTAESTRYDVADQIRAFRIKMGDPSLNVEAVAVPCDSTAPAPIPAESIAEIPYPEQDVSPLLIEQVDSAIFAGELEFVEPLRGSRDLDDGGRRVLGESQESSSQETVSTPSAGTRFGRLER